MSFAHLGAQLDVLPHPVQDRARGLEGRRPAGFEPIKPFGSAAAFGSGRPAARRDVPLGHEPLERGVDGPDRYRPARAAFDLFPDRDAVTAALQAGYRQQGYLLELTEKMAFTNGMSLRNECSLAFNVLQNRRNNSLYGWLVGRFRWGRGPGQLYLGVGLR